MSAGMQVAVGASRGNDSQRVAFIAEAKQQNELAYAQVKHLARTQGGLRA